MRKQRVAGIACVAFAAVIVVGVAAVATPPDGFVGEVNATGVIARDFRTRQLAGESTVVGTFTWEPGGTTGWHTHPGKTVVLIVSGELTIYREGTAPDCRGRTYGPGDGFVERPSSVHVGRNEGDEPVVAVATFFRVPPGTSPRIDEPDPGICPF
jgi:quercetin dioxygenase-like cupin family protein